MSWLLGKLGWYAGFVLGVIALGWSIDRAGYQRGVNHCVTAAREAAEAQAEVKRLAGRSVEVDAVTAERAVARTFTALEQEARDVFTAPSPRVPDAAAAPVPAPAAADRACLDPAAVGVWNRAAAAFTDCLAAGGADCAVRAAAATDAGHGERGAGQPRDDDAALHDVRTAAPGPGALASESRPEPGHDAREALTFLPLTITGVSDDELAEEAARQR